MANYHPDPAANSKSASIIEVDASVMKNADGASVDLTNTRQLAKWLVKRYQGKEVVVKDDGSKVTFIRRGLEASAKRRGLQQRQVYIVLDVLLENSIYDGYEEGDKRHPLVEKQNVYYAAVQMNGKLYSVKFKADVMSADGKMHYKDHKVSEIEIAPVVSIGAISVPPPYADGGNNAHVYRNEGMRISTIKEAFSADKGTTNNLDHQTIKQKYAELPSRPCGK